MTKSSPSLCVPWLVEDGSIEDSQNAKSSMTVSTIHMLALPLLLANATLVYNSSTQSCGSAPMITSK